MSKQKLSLQEQLLKSGLASTAQAKAAKTDKRKQTQQQRKNNTVIIDEAKQLALKAQAEKAERDRELNLLRKQQDEHKDLLAQVKQLIDLNRQNQNPEDDLAYHFNDHNKMKTLYVSATQREQLINGRLAIVKLDQSYDIVTSEVADKIHDRVADCVIIHNKSSATANNSSDDPYAEFQIPDDLMW